MGGSLGELQRGGYLGHDARDVSSLEWRSDNCPFGAYGAKERGMGMECSFIGHEANLLGISLARRITPVPSHELGIGTDREHLSPGNDTLPQRVFLCYRNDTLSVSLSRYLYLALGSVAVELGEAQIRGFCST